jgi:exonuclease SbcD
MKILHTADIHVGYETHGRLDAASGLNSRLLDFERSFKFMTDYAVRENIDLFLFCGDAYRDAMPSPTEQKIFANALKPVVKAGIPIVMLVGNHDNPISFGKASSIDIFSSMQTDNVFIFTKPDVKDIETKSGKVRLVALPWPIKSNLFARDEYKNLSPDDLKSTIERRYIDYVKSQADAVAEEKLNFPTVLAAHLHLDEAVLSEGSERVTLLTKDPTFPAQTLARPEFSYVALGHIHKHQNLNATSSPPVVYSGSIERISFGEVGQAKGFVIVEIDEAKKATFRHIETPARDFISIDTNARTSDDPTSLVLEDIAKENVKDAVVRVRVKLTDINRNALDLAAIREALKEAFVISEIKKDIEADAKKVRLGSVSSAMTTADALESYINQNERLKPMKPKLLVAAAKLEEELGDDF